MSPDNNIYKFVNQLEIVGTEKRIPDGIVYINGLPLVVFEFKSAIREEATIYDACKQLTVRYRRDIPELFKYNAFCVISDGVNNKAGSFFAPYEFFYAWRRVAGLAKDVDGIDSMFTLIQGMFHKNRLRDIIRNFIYIPDTIKERTKKLFVAIRNIMQQGHYLIISRKPKSPKETEKAELILAQQVAEKFHNALPHPLADEKRIL